MPMYFVMKTIEFEIKMMAVKIFGLGNRRRMLTAYPRLYLTKPSVYTIKKLILSMK
jgi:hypothetical protein